MGKSEQRRHRILGLLAEHGQVFVNDWPIRSARRRRRFGATLFRLEGRGLLRKVHGGAVRAQTAAKAAFSLRLSEQAHEKQRIAETAAGLFKRGDSLVLFSGTTTMALATVLARESGLTFVTNSVDIAANLWRGAGRNQVYLLGGEYHGEDFETIGR